jgi:hypothetical protein
MVPARYQFFDSFLQSEDFEPRFLNFCFASLEIRLSWHIDASHESFARRRIGQLS